MNIPKSNNNRVWKICFFLYLILIIRFIIFKYPMEQLLEIARGWKKEVILEGLSTANFTLGKSIKMYIRYFHRFPFWNGMANLFGNFLAFTCFFLFLRAIYLNYPTLLKKNYLLILSRPRAIVGEDVFFITGIA